MSSSSSDGSSKLRGQSKNSPRVASKRDVNIKDHLHVLSSAMPIANLIYRITATIESIDRDMLQKVCQELQYKLDACRVVKGSHIEHL
ncbi:hypothetical protein AVEN_116782-1 [Araneus ventricosus]|uniref:Uncharacterized protein n=1 Tax=Araneus ventricosus TaxID=182803 RepID=A0A4Y2D6E4_ARAVE|nr:hypothetical protein AVEN_116782-1 [Araneus ventricosus]